MTTPRPTGRERRPSSLPPGTGLADVICEQALLLGAGSTVLYQLADRGTGLGVAEHSTTLARPIDRLRTTLLYVYMMIRGTAAERRTISRMVNKAHAPVRSEGRYSAYDPELQLWVAATLAQNGLFITERIFGRFDDETREHFYRENHVLGNALQVKPEMWPATLAEFEEYWEKKIASFTAADPAVQVYVQRLMSVEARPRGLRRLGALQGLMSRGNLDPRIREVLGLTWTPRDQRRYDLFWKLFVPVYRLTPRFLRQLPARLVILDTRLRLRQGRRVI